LQRPDIVQDRNQPWGTRLSNTLDHEQAIACMDTGKHKQVAIPLADSFAEGRTYRRLDERH